MLNVPRPVGRGLQHDSTSMAFGMTGKEKGCDFGNDSTPTLTLPRDRGRE